MSILIESVQIPKNCDYCNASLALAVHCIMTQRIVFTSEYDVKKRHPSCPLRDVPPHVDLISREQAFQMMLDRGYQKEAAGVILEVPTVIPVNKEETEQGRIEHPDEV